MAIVNEYRLDLRERPVGQPLGHKQQVERCPSCGKGAVLFKRTTAKNGSRKEVWHHEIHIYLDEKQNPVRDHLVERCENAVSANVAAREVRARG